MFVRSRGPASFKISFCTFSSRFSNSSRSQRARSSSTSPRAPSAPAAPVLPRRHSPRQCRTELADGAGPPRARIHSAASNGVMPSSNTKRNAKRRVSALNITAPIRDQKTVPLFAAPPCPPRFSMFETDVSNRAPALWISVLRNDGYWIRIVAPSGIVAMTLSVAPKLFR